jgi:hypothetical protein
MLKPAHDKLLQQASGGTIHAAVEPSQMPDGSWFVPELANSSAVLLDSEAFEVVIEGGKAAAKDIMVRQIVAAPDASGARVDAEHASATAPLLAELAGTLETGINTGLYFTLRRFGLNHEQASAASVKLPRDYQLRDVVQDIDALLDTMEKAKVTSPTWLRYLAQRKGQELDLLPEEERDAIEAELEQSAALAKSALFKAQMDAVSSAAQAGANEMQAAIEVGMDPAVARRLFGDQSGAREGEEEGRPMPPVRVA